MSHAVTCVERPDQHAANMLVCRSSTAEQYCFSDIANDECLCTGSSIRSGADPAIGLEDLPVPDQMQAYVGRLQSTKPILTDCNALGRSAC